MVSSSLVEAFSNGSKLPHQGQWARCQRRLFNGFDVSVMLLEGVMEQWQWIFILSQACTLYSLTLPRYVNSVHPWNQSLQGMWPPRADSLISTPTWQSIFADQIIFGVLCDHGVGRICPKRKCHKNRMKKKSEFCCLKAGPRRIQGIMNKSNSDKVLTRKEGRVFLSCLH